MKKIIICILVVSSAIAQNSKDLMQKIDRSKTINLENQKKLEEKITIEEPEDFVWNDPTLEKGLGYKEIKFSKGKYTIYKDKKHPYGKITLPVKDSEKNDSSSSSFIGGCRLRGGYNCDRFGFKCLVIFINRGENQVKIDPIIKENKLIALDIEFFNEGEINGRKWDGKPENSEPMNPIKKGYYQTVMLQLVSESKIDYKQGQNVNEYAAATGVDYNSLSQNGKNLLNDMFKYVSKNTSDKEILENYDGTSIDKLINNSNEVPSSKKIKNFWKKLKLTLDAIGNIICIWSDEC